MGFILEPLWLRLRLRLGEAQFGGREGGEREVYELRLNNEVECVDKFICLICAWHAIFKFATSPKTAIWAQPANPTLALPTLSLPSPLRLQNASPGTSLHFIKERRFSPKWLQLLTGLPSGGWL